MSEERSLAVVPTPGLTPESLGNYLASLGLLRVLARRWASVRACWKGGVFQLVGGPEKLDEVLDELCDVAAKRAWTVYERGWYGAQLKSKKSSAPLALWQSSAEEGDLELFAAHIVPAARLNFNPLLGTGGNSAKRNFSKGWKRAIVALATTDGGARDSLDVEKKRADLGALLQGDPLTWLLEKLNAASWFSDANKLYNSGQRPFREGALSPWAMALACEGLAFFAGGSSRRLGAHARVVGAFPFVLGMLGSRTRVASPVTANEAGRDAAEVWAPLWQRPMTSLEVMALFARGRAEVRGRGVLTPSAFATAVIRRGVDAGIPEFRRFVLGRTTSSNTFEPRFEGAFLVSPDNIAKGSAAERSTVAGATALERLLSLVERLPADRRVADRWRFVGLRGPIEAAMLRVARTPANPEAIRGALDAVVAALDRVDRNQAFRERSVVWEPLPVNWVATLFGDEEPSTEARLALACVSGFPSDRPLTLYRFGVEWQRGRFVHGARSPARWVWRSGPLAPVLADVVHRRTLDWGAAREDAQPGRLQVPVASTYVALWLADSIDEDLLARWISRLALFDWRLASPAVRALSSRGAESLRPGARLCLFGLFAPLFDLRPVTLQGRAIGESLLPRECGARTAGVARTLARLLRAGQLDAAMDLASSRYAMANAPIIKTGALWDVGDAERLVASLLFSVSDDQRAALLERWLRPRRNSREVAHG